jgi:hypothetical protein
MRRWEYDSRQEWVKVDVGVKISKGFSRENSWSWDKSLITPSVECKGCKAKGDEIATF